ncbi:dTDP-4-dehydrorhamnose reductase [Rhodoferax sp. TBRC 17660]|uniref:dTDP-4-dehydrorhamnose reductase n=1 Tax=Rhodoferax potami TaxID=3068338 RepID=A0ABU3KPI9_9BURK|nr:dTDP-4-dehydrorhamnose reductase [Rhodoferax sp. TBRC 17660]MDT7519661.1 dTDP-4-dehydrorhamnose reductase [Rhodoferax sp. TBRC 17660]
MKILLLGRGGQVGWELQRSLSVLGEVVALDFDASQNPQGLCGDFTDLAGLERTVEAVRPDVIVNAAAHTAVDKAESEPELARAINALAPAALARAAIKTGAWLIHYSTDYVFDGRGDMPWTEADATGPLSVYGQTKLEGEQAVALNPKHLILRTSWVYATRGGNFAKTMLRLAGERESLTVISDQFGAPTSADLLADVTAHAIRTLQTRPELAGLYHCIAAGETTWHGYAQFVLAEAAALGLPLKATADKVAPTPTSSYPTPAKRPLNSRLDTRKLQAAFGLTLPHWQAGVRRMLIEISGK